MLTKSKIQLIREQREMINNFSIMLEDLMNKYDVEDGVFTLKNQQLFEVTKGYFEKTAAYTSLKEALVDEVFFTNANACIRIKNNEQFEVGVVHKFLNECRETSEVVELDRLLEV